MPGWRARRRVWTPARRGDLRRLGSRRASAGISIDVRGSWTCACTSERRRRGRDRRRPGTSPHRRRRSSSPVPLASAAVRTRDRLRHASVPGLMGLKWARHRPGCACVCFCPRNAQDQSLAARPTLVTPPAFCLRCSSLAAHRSLLIACCACCSAHCACSLAAASMRGTMAISARAVLAALALASAVAAGPATSSSPRSSLARRYADMWGGSCSTASDCWPDAHGDTTCNNGQCNTSVHPLAARLTCPASATPATTSAPATAT